MTDAEGAIDEGLNLGSPRRLVTQKIKLQRGDHRGLMKHGRVELESQAAIANAEQHPAVAARIGLRTGNQPVAGQLVSALPAAPGFPRGGSGPVRPGWRYRKSVWQSQSRPPQPAPARYLFARDTSLPPRRAVATGSGSAPANLRYRCGPRPRYAQGRSLQELGRVCRVRRRTRAKGRVDSVQNGFTRPCR